MEKVIIKKVISTLPAKITEIKIERPKVKFERVVGNLIKGESGKDAYNFAQQGGYLGTQEDFSTALNLMTKNVSLRLSYEINDWEEYGTGLFRLIIPQSVHGLANTYVDEMELYNEEDESWENNLTPTQKRLANDSIVITSDRALKCNIILKGEI